MSLESTFNRAENGEQSHDLSEMVWNVDPPDYKIATRSDRERREYALQKWGNPIAAALSELKGVERGINHVFASTPSFGRPNNLPIHEAYLFPIGPAVMQAAESQGLTVWAYCTNRDFPWQIFQPKVQHDTRSPFQKLFRMPLNLGNTPEISPDFAVQIITEDAEKTGCWKIKAKLVYKPVQL